jgi:hypothetical protein
MLAPTITPKGGRTLLTRHRILVVALAIVWLAGWLAAAGAANDYLYIEPTDEAVALAARAAPRGATACLVMLMAGVAVAVVRRHAWGLVLVLPPLVTGYFFVARTPHHGEPTAALLGSSLLIFAVGVGRFTVRRVNAGPGSR